MNLKARTALAAVLTAVAIALVALIGIFAVLMSLGLLDRDR